MSYLSFDDESALINGRSTYRSDVKMYYRDIQPQIPGTYSNLNNIITFRLPNESNSFLNLSNVRFDFAAAATGTSSSGSCTIAFGNGISQIVNRIQVRVNGTTLIDELQSGLVSHVINDLLLPSNDSQSGVMTLSRGCSTVQATRNGWASGRQYRIPLGFKKGFTYQNSILPCYPNQYIDIILTLESNVPACTEMTVTAGVPSTYSYSVSNPVLCCEFFYSPTLSSKFMGKPYSIPFTDYQYFTQQLTTSNSTVNLSVANRSIKAIMVLLRDSTTYNSILTADKMDHFYQTVNSAALQTMQFFINQNPVPSQAITTTGQNTRLLWELYKALKIDENNGPIYLDTNYTTNKFLIYYEFESLRDYVSGINASNTTIPLQVQLNFSQAPTSAIQCDFFIFYDSVLTISDKGCSVAK